MVNSAVATLYTVHCIYSVKAFFIFSDLTLFVFHDWISFATFICIILLLLLLVFCRFCSFQYSPCTARWNSVPLLRTLGVRLGKMIWQWYQPWSDSRMAVRLTDALPYSGWLVTRFKRPLKSSLAMDSPSYQVKIFLFCKKRSGRKKYKNLILNLTLKFC